jgi:hypothetical protein
MAQGPDSQAFWELKKFYPWLGDAQLALLQGVYHTWRQLAEANPGYLLSMLSGIPLPPESPGITWDQVGIIIAFAQEKVRLQEEETT